MYVTGSFNGWTEHATPLVRKGDIWTAEIDTEPGKLAYKFIIDGQWITDPANPRTEGDGQYTNSVAEAR